MWPELTAHAWSAAVAVGRGARRRRAGRPRRDRDHAGRAVAVGAAGRGARGGRRARSARSLDRLPADGRRAALPGAARPGQRALLRRVLRGAPCPGRRGAGDGAPARRRRAAARRLPDLVLLAVAGEHRRRSGSASPRSRSRSPARTGQRARLRRVGTACARWCSASWAGRAEMFAAAEVARARGRAAAHPLRAAGARQPAAALAGDGRTVRRLRGDLRSGSRRSTPRSRSTSRRRPPPARIVVIAIWRGDARRGRRRSCSRWRAVRCPISADRGLLPVAQRPGGGRAPTTRPTRSTSTAEDWFSLLNWGMAADVSPAPGRPDPGGATPTPGSLPYAGTSCAPAPATTAGPVDLSSRWPRPPRGDRDLAARHADDAERLCAEWEIPLAGQWLRGQRDRYGF